MVFERRVPIKTGNRTSRSKASGGYRKRPRPSIVDGLLSGFSRVIIGIILLILLVGGGYMTFLSLTLPDVSIISKTIPHETTTIYSADNVVLADLHKEENRLIVPLSKISPTMRKAVVALEDSRFYRHHGIDPIGIVRATVVNVVRGEKAQGASTITQQLARHLFLSKQKKFQRKVAEIVLAFKIERKYTKDEILEMYLNQVYWGHNAYGIESASLQYFGKHAEELSIAESALLAGMLRAPEFYSPFRNPQEALKRKDVVLKRMFQTHLISRKQYQDAKQKKLNFVTRQNYKYKAPYFSSMIIDKLVSMYGEEAAFNSGLRVYTPINYRMQLAAEFAVEHAIKNGETEGLNYSQAALLAMDSNTGYIVAMVGGYDFRANQFNKCTQALRQPGSSFKPFVYLTALSKGVSPGTIFTDSPVVYDTVMGPYAPENYDKTYEGRMPMRAALEKSKNVVAVKLVSMVKPESVVETAKLFGITSPLYPYLSIALGSQEVTMLQMVTAYSAFANGGTLVKPVSIIRIEDRNGVVIYREKTETQKVFDTNLVSALVEMMKSVVEKGTGTAAKIPRPMAGKTGTTSDFRDAWFIGFIPQMAVAAWVGNDNNSPMVKVTGGSAPAVMWREFMNMALENVPMLDFQKPAGMEEISICWTSGKKAGAYCPVTSVEKFWEGNTPTTFCDVHGGGSRVRPDSATPEKKPADWVKDLIEQ